MKPDYPFMAHIEYSNHAQRTLNGEWEITQVGGNWLDVTRYKGKTGKVLGERHFVVGECNLGVTNFIAIERSLRGLPPNGPFKYDSILDIIDVRFTNETHPQVTSQRTWAGKRESPQVRTYDLPLEFARKRRPILLDILKKVEIIF